MIICVFPVCKRKATKATAGFTVVFEPNLLLIVRHVIRGCGGWLVVKVTKHNEFNDRECFLLT